MKKEDRPLFVAVLTLPLAIVAMVFAIGSCSHHATTASITSQTTVAISEEQPKTEIIAEVKGYDAEWAACEKSFVHKSKIEDCQFNIAVKSFDPSKKSRAAWIAEDLPDIISKYQLFLLTSTPLNTADQEQRKAEIIAEQNQYDTNSLACKKSFDYEAQIEICQKIALSKFLAAREKSRAAWIAKDLPEIRSTPEKLARGHGNYADLDRGTRELQGLNIQNKIRDKLDKLTEARYSADPIPASIPPVAPTPVATSNSIDVEKGLIPIDSESNWAKTTTTRQDPFAALAQESGGQSKKSK